MTPYLAAPQLGLGRSAKPKPKRRLPPRGPRGRFVAVPAPAPAKPHLGRAFGLVAAVWFTIGALVALLGAQLVRPTVGVLTVLN